MSGPRGVTPELIIRQAAEMDGRQLSPGRAEQIAAEVDQLNRLVLAATASAPALLDDPAGFPGALEALRDPWPDAP